MNNPQIDLFIKMENSRISPLFFQFFTYVEMDIINYYFYVTIIFQFLPF